MKLIHFFIAAFCTATTLTHVTPPLVLFAKTNTTWIPLRGKKDDLMTYLFSQNSSAPPFEFILKNNYIMTPERDNPQYVGFFLRTFAIGPEFIKNRFEYDEEGKILHKSFFKCDVSNSNFILMYGRGVKHCTAVDVHLLPYDNKTMSPIKNIPVSYVKKLMDVSKISSGEVGNFNEPLFLHVRIGNKFIPLSGLADDTSRIGIFVWGSTLLPPIELTFRDGHSNTKNTPIPHSVGFHKHYLSYGPGIKSKGWQLSKAKRIKHFKFYSCAAYDVIYRTLSVIALDRNDTENCFRVSIYLKPIVTAKGKH